MSFKLEICRSVVLLVAVVIVVMGAAAEATDTVMGAAAEATDTVMDAAAMTTDTVMGGASKAIDTKLVSANCNKQKISSGSPFYKNLGAVLEDLKQNTAFSGYEYKTSRAGSGGAPTAYGRGICSQSVSQSDCKACLSNVAKRIYHICNNAIGARVQLTDCFLQYEQHNF